MPPITLKRFLLSQARACIAPHSPFRFNLTLCARVAIYDRLHGEGEYIGRAETGKVSGCAENEEI